MFRWGASKKPPLISREKINEKSREASALRNSVAEEWNAQGLAEVYRSLKPTEFPLRDYIMGRLKEPDFFEELEGRAKALMEQTKSVVA